MVQAVRGCPLVSTLQLEVADGSAMTINLNRLLGASKVRVSVRVRTACWARPGCATPAPPSAGRLL